MKHISQEQLQQLVERDAVTLIEALPEMHYEAEHLPGAVNLPGPLSPELAASLTPDLARTVVVYCSGPSCGRSAVTAGAFERLGYADVRVYKGGKSEWAAAGLPFQGARAAVA